MEKGGIPPHINPKIRGVFPHIPRCMVMTGFERETRRGF